MAEKIKNRASEELLSAWLAASSRVRNERIVQVMTFREICVCNLINKNEKMSVTATDIIKVTGMLKSQVNKVLTDMEEKGFIVRTRSMEDRRRIYIDFTDKGYEIYSKEHEKILKIMDSVIKEMGEEETLRVAEGLFKITEIITNHDSAKK